MRKTIAYAAFIFSLSLQSVSHAEDWYVARTGAENIYAATLGNSCRSWTGFIRTGTYPAGLAINPAGSRVYVTNYASAPVQGGDSVTVIDTATSTPVSTITGISAPHDVVVSASRAYVASSSRVVVIDTASNTVIGNVNLGGTVARLAYNATTNRVFATTYSALVVIDAATNAVVNTITMDNAGDVAVTPDGRRAYVARTTPGPVAVVDLESNTVVGTITVDGLPTAVAINQDGTRAFVALNRNTGGTPHLGGLSAIDIGNNSIITTVNTGVSPYEVAAGRNWVLVSNTGSGVNSGTVTQVSTSSFATHEFEVGGLPAGIAVFERPIPPPAILDAEVTGIEVTQGIQDLAQSVRLLGDRRTYARVYVRSRTGGALPPITAYIYGNTATSGYGSLAPSNRGGSIAIPASPRRQRLSDSFFFELPRHWTTRDTALRINVELQRAGQPAPFCNYDGPNRTVGFQEGALLNYQFVRLKYTWADRMLEATEEQQSAAESMIYRLFPVSRMLSHSLPVRTHYTLDDHVARTHDDCEEYLPAEDVGACAAEFVNFLIGLEHMFGYKDADGVYGLIPPVPEDLDPTGRYGIRGYCCTNLVSSGSAADPMTAAHEIAHRFGREHPNEMSDICGHKGGDPDYPYPLTAIHPLFPYDPATGLAGFDIGDGTLDDAHGSFPGAPRGVGAPPRAIAPDAVYDYMSYCGSYSWTSDYTYRALFDSLRAQHPYDGKISRDSAVRARLATPQAGNWLLVGGAIFPGGTRPGSLFAMRVGLVTHVPDRVPGAYSIRLIGAGGAQLADYPFTPRPQSDTAPATSRSSYMHALDFVDGTREIQLVETAGNRVLTTRAVSSGLPVVSNIVVQGPVNPATGEVSLSWSGSDPDNDTLTYDILVTRNGGTTYEPLVSGLPATSTMVDTSDVGGGTATFRVRANDGVNTATADSPGFSIPNKAPKVRILNPPDGATLNEGQALILEGYATDAQDDIIPDANLVWRLAGRTIGTGRNLDLSDLAVGAYPVTLTATNSLGISTTAAVAVTFNAIVADPVPRLSVGPDAVNWQVAPGETQAQTRTLDVGNVGTGSLTFTAQLSGAGNWLSLDSASGTAPASITLTANPGGMTTGTLKRATLTVTGMGLNGQTIAIPVTLAVGKTIGVKENTSPPPVVPAPVADAGVDQTTTEGNSVTLTGAASTVATGHAASYQWTQRQGTAVTLTGGTTATAQFTAPRPSGTSELLRFELAVSDDTGQRAVDEVSITVNALPVSAPPPPPPPANNPPKKAGGGAFDWWTLAALLALISAGRSARRSNHASARCLPHSIKWT